MLSNQAISECLAAYGDGPTDAQCEQVRAYISLLLKWNKSMSLTTVTEEAEVLKFHFGESLFALRSISGIENGRLADVGAGAGFPGLPIRIFSPELELVLIESNAKKCAFLSEVVRHLDLKGVCVRRSRFEETSEFQGKIDTISARALGDYDQFLEWALGSLAVGGRIALWLGEDDASDISRKRGWNWDDPVRIPASQHRLILAGSPVARQ
ncbi:MAG: 16S rRNA (guanine(527)-N(7))-methyltransferase RsmG [Candidatus Acidiferrales bacterium]